MRYAGHERYGDVEVMLRVEGVGGVQGMECRKMRHGEKGKSARGV